MGGNVDQMKENPYYLQYTLNNSLRGSRGGTRVCGHFVATDRDRKTALVFGSPPSELDWWFSRIRLFGRSLLTSRLGFTSAGIRHTKESLLHKEFYGVMLAVRDR